MTTYVYFSAQCRLWRKKASDRQCPSNKAEALWSDPSDKRGKWTIPVATDTLSSAESTADWSQPRWRMQSRHILNQVQVLFCFQCTSGFNDKRQKDWKHGALPKFFYGRNRSTRPTSKYIWTNLWKQLILSNFLANVVKSVLPFIRANINNLSTTLKTTELNRIVPWDFVNQKAVFVLAWLNEAIPFSDSQTLLVSATNHNSLFTSDEIDRKAFDVTGGNNPWNILTNVFVKIRRIGMIGWQHLYAILSVKQRHAGLEGHLQQDAHHCWRNKRSKRALSPQVCCSRSAAPPVTTDRLPEETSRKIRVCDSALSGATARKSCDLQLNYDRRSTACCC